MIDRIVEKAKKQNKKVYIYAHRFPDGDAISSASAIAEYLKEKGIDAKYIITNPVNTYSKVVGQISSTRTVDKDSIAIIVDTSTLDYAENKLFSKNSPENTFVIDHHIKSEGIPCIEDQLGLEKQNVIRDPLASSTCEILVNEFERKKITPKIAEMLTLGLMTDTAKLKFLKPNTLKNLQVLLEAGADYEKVVSLCTRKSDLRNEVGMAKILLNSQKVNIGDTFGIILPVNNEIVNSMNSEFGLRSIQKKIFKMADINNCSFNCIFAENSAGEFDLEFRSSSIYGDFDVYDLAAINGGGGHHNASGCHLSKKNGYNGDTIFAYISKYLSDKYLDQATGLKPITLTEKDKELTTILNKTKRLTKGVDASVLSKIDNLRNSGANYDYTFINFKTYERFMLENEILSRIPSNIYMQKQPNVNINLNRENLNMLLEKYNVSEDEILSLIDMFSCINIKTATITLPDGKKRSISNNGDISTGHVVNKNKSVEEISI